jgi:Secretion system C-terminal sorting domain
LIVHDDKLFAVGTFTEAGGIPANYIAVWDNEKWCSLGGSFDNIIVTETVFKDTLIIGGGFWTIDGDSMYYISKWAGDGFRDSCQVVGIDELNLQEYILIYPSPVKCYLNIESKNIEIKKIGITDLSGKKILPLDYNKVMHKLNVSNLTPGIYFLMIETKEGNCVKKFVKE